MKEILHYSIALLAGGLITSTVEYRLKYNLIDLIKDKIHGLFSKGADATK